MLDDSSLPDSSWPRLAPLLRCGQDKTNAMPNYKVLGYDNKEYGPISADVVRQWIAQGRVAGQTRVQAEGSADWQPASEVPEFAEALARRPVPAGPPPLAPRPASATNNRLAVASLVFGILSVTLAVFLVGLLAGLAAVITGHRARGRARGEPARYGGAGMATGGLVLGYLGTACSLFMAILVLGLVIPAAGKERSKIADVRCQSNMKQILLAARMYALDNKERFPPDFLTMSNELSSPRVLRCPGDKTRTEAAKWTDFSPQQNVSYEFLKPGAVEVEVAGEVVLRCPVHQHLGYGDGSVQRGGVHVHKR